MGTRGYLFFLSVLTTQLTVAPAGAHPCNFTEADALLTAELPDMQGRVAVILRQDGTELYRFQAGEIGYDTRTRLASFTKTISAAVILALGDEGLISLNERIGDAIPLFDARGIGDPTVLDAWAMRHGIDSDVPYEHHPLYTLAQSVTLLGLNGYLVFSPPGSRLHYDGAGMQAVGRIAELRTGLSWEQIARTRILDPCHMPLTDYRQFHPNPSVPGGIRSTATETIRFAQMIIDGGWYGGKRVLSEAAINRLFTNGTRDLPVLYTPWPLNHPGYPYGTDPDYAFGAWVLAEHPASRHVEEIVGAGAWGSYLWIDRRRALTAVLITDVPGAQISMDAALGLFDIARRQVESQQVRALVVKEPGEQVRLAWQRPAGSSGVRVYGAAAPIRDIYDLRRAVNLGQVAADSVFVPPYDHYAVIAVWDDFRNPALIPGVNATHTLRGDFNADGRVGAIDLGLLMSCLSGPAVPHTPGCGYADLDDDGDVDQSDFGLFQRNYTADH